MPNEKAPSSGAFLPASLMYFCSGQPMHFCSGVDTDCGMVSPIAWATSVAVGFVLGFNMWPLIQNEIQQGPMNFQLTVVVD